MKTALLQKNNTRLLYLLSHWLNRVPDLIRPGEIRLLARSCGLPLAEAYGLLLAGAYDLDIAENEEDKAFWQGWILPMLQQEKIETYQADPYYRRIRVGSHRFGPWRLCRETLPAFRPFVRDDMLLLPDGRVLPQIGFFAEPYLYPAVLEGGREWMTLLPNETVSTRPAVEEAEGNVLTYGLGLGYFPFMAAEKANVLSVTVVERSPEVLSLFRRLLLPQFPHKEKIRLIRADALDFAAHEVVPGKYDYIFADIWHDVGDGLPLYAQLKAWENKAPGSRFRYWIQPTMDLYLADEHWLPEGPRTGEVRG